MNIRRACRALAIAGLLVGATVAPVWAAVINGTSGPDVLTGTARADTIRGYAGADNLNGKAGADTLYGGDGADRLFPGNDSQTDILRGGSGPDRIVARTGVSGGRDAVYAGAGNDVVTVAEVHGWYLPYVNCGTGYDTVVLPKTLTMQTTGCERVLHGPW